MKTMIAPCLQPIPAGEETGKTAFTLIELITVIAIIAILAGLGSRDNSFGLGGHFPATGTKEQYSPVRENEIVSPSDMIAIGDGFVGWNGIIEDGKTLLWRTPTAKDYLGSSERSFARHRKRAQIVFCDGHTQFMTLEALFSKSSNQMLGQWNRDNRSTHE